MEVEGLMKQLEYLDKLEADEESNRRRGYDGGYAANGESVRQQRSVGIKFEQTGQNRGRIAPEPSRSVGAHMRMDHSHEANEGRGSATGHTRIPTQSKFSTGVARSVSDVQPSSDNGEVGRQVASLQDSLVTMGIVADRKNSMKPSPSGRFHKFTSRPLDSRTRAAGNVSPRDEKREKLSVSPIRRGPGGVSSPSHLSEAQNQLSDINSQSDVQKSLKNGLVAPEPTDRGAKSFPKRHQQPHLAPPSRTQGGFGTIDKANRGIEHMEESVDEESSIVEQEDSRRPCLEMKCIQECNISEKTTRSRNVLRSVNRRHRHSADPESVISSYKSTSTELKMGSAKELIDIKYKSGETDGPYSEPKSSSSDQFSRSQSKASGQGVMSSFGSARGGGVLDPPGTLELACTDSKTNLKGDVNFGDGERRVRAARQNRERADEGQKSRPRALQKDTVSGDQSSTSPMPDWSKTMDMRKGEVELLLRRPINSDEDIQFTLAAAEAGLIFMDEVGLFQNGGLKSDACCLQLDRVAKSLHMLRGSLSRWLLPYDNNTAITDQISSVHSVVASMPDYLRGRLTERQVNYLVSGVNGVRQLIRVKIADDNDLEQAREALQTAVDFLKRLQTDASSASGGMTPYQLLRFN
ncbi:unnamed protein product [Symbiodinium microadriaticum]|nr:unnamed protein product [Symbiodinium microadriaticum]